MALSRDATTIAIPPTFSATLFFHLTISNTFSTKFTWDPPSGVGGRVPPALKLNFGAIRLKIRLIDGLLGHLSTQRLQPTVDVTGRGRGRRGGGVHAAAETGVAEILLVTAERRGQRHHPVSAAAAVPPVHELLLGAVERHQIVERVTVVGRGLVWTWRRQLLRKLVVVVLLKHRELVELLATSGSLEICEARGVGAEVGVRGALVAAAGAVGLRHVVVLHRTLAVNFW